MGARSFDRFATLLCFHKDAVEHALSHDSDSLSLLSLYHFKKKKWWKRTFHSTLVYKYIH